MEAVRNLNEISNRLESLNNLYSVWHFNHYLRVTYVSPTWLVVWDHRHSPPERHDFRDIGDHEIVCRLTAVQLQKLATE